MPTTGHGSYPSYCRLCSAICGVVVDVDDGRVVAVRGDRDHPLSHGFTCVKGRNLGPIHHDPHRFVRSQRRRADGSFEPVGASAAIDEIGGRLLEITGEHGPDSVGLYVGTQNYNATLG